ncbi:HIT domain-containing protein [bacterium]|nr:HIT domain-containing protein [bacterium]
MTNLVLFGDDDIFVIMNKFPYNPYHLMVLPKIHTGEITDLPTNVWQKLNLATHACVDLIKQTVSPHGFNLGMNIGEAGGAGIAPHLHMHVIPRWRGDTNFMPLIAETKALPTHNETVYNALMPKFEHFADRL